MTPANASTESLLHRLTRGTLLTALGRVSGMGTVFVLHVFLARTLPTSEYATFVLVWSWVTLFGLIGSFGLSTLACRHLAASLAQGEAKWAVHALKQMLIVGVGTVSISAVVGALLTIAVPTAWLPVPATSSALLAIGLWIALLAVAQIQAEMFRGLHQLFAASLLGGMSGGLLSNLVLVVGLVGLPHVGHIDVSTVIALMPLTLGLQCALALVVFIVSWRKQPLLETVGSDRIAPLTKRALIHDAAPIMTAQVTSFGVAQFDIWLVGIFGGVDALAVYAVARRLALLVAIPVNQMGQIASSFISQLYVQQRRQALASLLKGVSTVGALCTLPPLLLLVFCGERVLSELFGAEFESGAMALRWFCLGQFAFAMTGPSGPTLLMTGQQRAVVLSMVIPLPLLILAPVAIQQFGSTGIAALFGTYVAINNVLQWLFVRSRLDLKTEPCFDFDFLRHGTMALRAYGFPVARVFRAPDWHNTPNEGMGR